MRFLSLAALPFFFAPRPVSDAAALLKAMPAPAPALASRTVEAPSPGHRARASGCRAESVPAGPSVSLGSPTRGELEGGRFLGESELVHHVDAHRCAFWGTDELLGVIERAAAAVATDHQGHRLTVGELSQREGGDIAGHNSHENGRDVDFGFYFLDEAGEPYEPRRFVDVRRDRSAIADGQTLRFDVERNWKLVAALLQDEEADINIILVAGRIRRWLLAHARSIGVPAALYRQASRVLLRPRPGQHPHRNHFHVRIYCPETDEGCHDRNRLWDWVTEARAARASARRPVTNPG